MPLLACLIIAPQRGYDEPAILSYAISSFCPTSADGLQADDAALLKAPGADPGLASLLKSGVQQEQDKHLPDHLMDTYYLA